MATSDFTGSGMDSKITTRLDTRSESNPVPDKHFGLDNFDFALDDGEDAGPSISLSSLGKKAFGGFVGGIADAIAVAMPKSTKVLRGLDGIGAEFKDVIKVGKEALGNVAQSTAPLAQQLGAITNNKTIQNAANAAENFGMMNAKDWDLETQSSGSKGTRKSDKVSIKDVLQTLSQERVITNKVNQELGSIFKAQTSVAAAQLTAYKTATMHASQLSLAQHGQSLAVLNNIHKQVAFNSQFLSNVYTPYMRKDLELKYRLLYAQQDVLKVAQAQLITLRMINKNVMLPEYIKRENIEKIASKQDIGTRLKRGVGSTLADWKKDFKGALFNTIKERVKGLAGTVSQAAGMGSMLLGGGGEINSAGDFFKMLINSGVEKLGHAAGSGVMTALKNTISPRDMARLEHAIGNVETQLPLLLKSIANGRPPEFFNKLPKPLQVTLSMLAGGIGGGISNVGAGNTQGLSMKRNSVYSDLKQAGTITNRFIVTVEDIIPNYLKLQTRFLEAIATGQSVSDVQTREWNTERDELTSTSSYINDITKKFKGNLEATSATTYSELARGSFTANLSTKRGKNGISELEAVQKSNPYIFKVINNLAYYSTFGGSLIDESSWLTYTEAVIEATKDPDSANTGIMNKVQSILGKDVFEGFKGWITTAFEGIPESAWFTTCVGLNLLMKRNKREFVTFLEERIQEHALTIEKAQQDLEKTIQDNQDNTILRNLVAKRDELGNIVRDDEGNMVADTSSILKNLVNFKTKKNKIGQDFSKIMADAALTRHDKFMDAADIDHSEGGEGSLFGDILFGGVANKVGNLVQGFVSKGLQKSGIAGGIDKTARTAMDWVAGHDLGSTGGYIVKGKCASGEPAANYTEAIIKFFTQAPAASGPVKQAFFDSVTEYDKNNNVIISVNQPSYRELEDAFFNSGYTGAFKGPLIFLASLFFNTGNSTFEAIRNVWFYNKGHSGVLGLVRGFFSSRSKETYSKLRTDLTDAGIFALTAALTITNFNISESSIKETFKQVKKALDNLERGNPDEFEALYSSAQEQGESFSVLSKAFSTDYFDQQLVQIENEKARETWGIDTAGSLFTDEEDTISKHANEFESKNSLFGGKKFDLSGAGGDAQKLLGPVALGINTQTKLVAAGNEVRNKILEVLGTEAKKRQEFLDLFKITSDNVYVIAERGGVAYDNAGGRVTSSTGRRAVNPHGASAPGITTAGRNMQAGGDDSKFFNRLKNKLTKGQKVTADELREFSTVNPTEWEEMCKKAGVDPWDFDGYIAKVNPYHKGTSWFGAKSDEEESGGITQSAEFQALTQEADINKSLLNIYNLLYMQMRDKGAINAGELSGMGGTTGSTMTPPPPPGSNGGIFGKIKGFFGKSVKGGTTPIDTGNPYQDAVLNFQARSVSLLEEILTTLNTGVAVAGRVGTKTFSTFISGVKNRIKGVFGGVGRLGSGLVSGLFNVAKFGLWTAPKFALNKIGGELIGSALFNRKDDVYVRPAPGQNIDSMTPVLTTEMIRQGVFADKECTKRIKSINDIHGPVYGPNGTELITKAQYKYGLVVRTGPGKFRRLHTLFTRAGRLAHNLVGGGLGLMGKTFGFGLDVLTGKRMRNLVGSILSTPYGALSAGLSPYVDVYSTRDPAVLLVSANDFKNHRVCYENGKPVEDVYSINNVVMWADIPANGEKRGQVAIQVEDFTNGHYLIDVQGRKLNTFGKRLGSIGRKLIGGAARLGLAGAGNLLKLPGIALGLLGKAATFAFKKSNPYIDVFVKEENGTWNPKKPRLRGIEIQRGAEDPSNAKYFFSDGTVVTSAYNITSAVYTKKDGDDNPVMLISDEEATRLCDVRGKLLTKFRGKSLVGKALHIGGAAIGSAFNGAWKLASMGLKGLWGAGKFLTGGIFDGIKGLGKGLFNGITDLIHGRGHVNRKDLEEVVGNRLLQIYDLLDTRLSEHHDLTDIYNLLNKRLGQKGIEGVYDILDRRLPKSEAGDSDNDGDRDGSARDQLEKAEKAKSHLEAKKDKRKKEAEARKAKEKAEKEAKEAKKATEEGGSGGTGILGTAMGNMLGKAGGRLLGSAGGALGSLAGSAAGLLANPVGLTIAGVAAAGAAAWAAYAYRKELAAFGDSAFPEWRMLTSSSYRKWYGVKQELYGLSKGPVDDSLFNFIKSKASMVINPIGTIVDFLDFSENGIVSNKRKGNESKLIESVEDLAQKLLKGQERWPVPKDTWITIGNGYFRGKSWLQEGASWVANKVSNWFTDGDDMLQDQQEQYTRTLYGMFAEDWFIKRVFPIYTAYLKTVKAFVDPREIQGRDVFALNAALIPEEVQEVALEAFRKEAENSINPEWKDLSFDEESFQKWKKTLAKKANKNKESKTFQKTKMTQEQYDVIKAQHGEDVANATKAALHGGDLATNMKRAKSGQAAKSILTQLADGTLDEAAAKKELAQLATFNRYLNNSSFSNYSWGQQEHGGLTRDELEDLRDGTLDVDTAVALVADRQLKVGLDEDMENISALAIRFLQLRMPDPNKQGSFLVFHSYTYNKQVQLVMKKLQDIYKELGPYIAYLKSTKDSDNIFTPELLLNFGAGTMAMWNQKFKKGLLAAEEQWRKAEAMKLNKNKSNSKVIAEAQEKAAQIQDDLFSDLRKDINKAADEQRDAQTKRVNEEARKLKISQKDMMSDETLKKAVSEVQRIKSNDNAYTDILEMFKGQLIANLVRKGANEDYLRTTMSGSTFMNKLTGVMDSKILEVAKKHGGKFRPEYLFEDMEDIDVVDLGIRLDMKDFARDVNAKNKYDTSKIVRSDQKSPNEEYEELGHAFSDGLMPNASLLKDTKGKLLGKLNSAAKLLPPQYQRALLLHEAGHGPNETLRYDAHGNELRDLSDEMRADRFVVTKGYGNEMGQLLKLRNLFNPSPETRRREAALTYAAVYGTGEKNLPMARNTYGLDFSDDSQDEEDLGASRAESYYDDPDVTGNPSSITNKLSRAFNWAKDIASNTLDAVGDFAGNAGIPGFGNQQAAPTIDLSGIKAVNIPDGGAGDLGAYVARWESGKKGPAAIGYDSTGGTSYGTYQLASKVGTLGRALDFFATAGGDFGKKLAEAMRKCGNLNTGSRSGAGPSVWKQFAAVDGGNALRKLEHAFIYKTHYKLALDGLKSAAKAAVEGDRGLQEALWSTSVQHGPGGAKKIFNSTFQEGITPSAWLTAIYQKRGGCFGRSTPQVQASVRRRFKEELPVVLGLCGKNPVGESGEAAPTEENNATATSGSDASSAQALADTAKDTVQAQQTSAADGIIPDAKTSADMTSASTSSSGQQTTSTTNNEGTSNTSTDQSTSSSSSTSATKNNSPVSSDVKPTVIDSKPSDTGTTPAAGSNNQTKESVEDKQMAEQNQILNNVKDNLTQFCEILKEQAKSNMESGGKMSETIVTSIDSAFNKFLGPDSPLLKALTASSGGGMAGPAVQPGRQTQVGPNVNKSI